MVKYINPVLSDDNTQGRCNRCCPQVAPSATIIDRDPPSLRPPGDQAGEYHCMISDRVEHWCEPWYRARIERMAKEIGYLRYRVAQLEGKAR